MDGLRQVLARQEALCDTEEDEAEERTLLDVGWEDARTGSAGWSRRVSRPRQGRPELEIREGAGGTPLDPETTGGSGEGMVHLPGPEDVTRFASLILKTDTTDAFALIERLLQRGVSAEALYLDLLAPAARRLGDLWVADVCDFTEVTIGLGRLQQLMHELAMDFQTESPRLTSGRRVLLLPAPGNQHTFGVLMIAEFFRKSGWDVWTAPAASLDATLDLVQRQSFPLVGFSIGCERHLDGLSDTIRRIRRHGRSRTCGVMVGGPLVTRQPDMVARVGADATATDARQAAAQAQKLLDLPG